MRIYHREEQKSMVVMNFRSRINMLIVMAMTNLPAVTVFVVIVVVFVVGTVDAVPIKLSGVNYSIRQGADWEPFKCKQPYQVLTDLSLLNRVTKNTRVLSLTDCGGGSIILGAAKELGMKVWLGLWVDVDETVFEGEVDELARMLEDGEIDGSTVLGVTVGSEALYREDATIDQMLFYLGRVRNLLDTFGLSNLPVSIVDIEPMYTAYPQLREEVDVTYINSFPFWEATPIDTAVDYLAEKAGNLLSTSESRGKPFIVGETGWPSDGFIEGVGVASSENQQQYFIDAFCYMEQQGWEYYWFTGIDNAWRQVQE